MKILSAIVLFYFSLLLVQPMVTLIHNGLTKEKEVCTMSCCQHHKTEKKETKKSPFGCCNDTSNPLIQFSCCVGFIAEQQNTWSVGIPHENKMVFTNTGILIPNYSSDCWRPPKMAA